MGGSAIEFQAIVLKLGNLLILNENFNLRKQFRSARLIISLSLV